MLETLHHTSLEYAELAVYQLHNINDMPALCDFFFAATHRFVDQATGKKSLMQLAITANGDSCRLAGRIRREAVAVLPCEFGGAVVFRSAPTIGTRTRKGIGKRHSLGYGRGH